MNVSLADILNDIKRFDEIVLNEHFDLSACMPKEERSHPIIAVREESGLVGVDRLRPIRVDSRSYPWIKEDRQWSPAADKYHGRTDSPTKHLRTGAISSMKIS